MRLRDLSQDTSSNGCVAWYNGRYENDYAQTREVVAVQTAKTALLRMRHLVECAEQCQRASADDNLSAGFQRCHLIVDEADHGDEWMLLLLTAGKALATKGLVKLWIMSATLDVETQLGCTVIDLGGVAFPLRIVPVLVDDPDRFKAVAADLAAQTARKGKCTLVFVPGQTDTTDVASALLSFQEAIGDYTINGKCDVITNHSKSSKADSERLLERVPRGV